jgi:hypothetical protein
MSLSSFPNSSRRDVGFSMRGRRLNNSERSGNIRLRDPLEINTPGRSRAHAPNLSARGTFVSLTTLRKVAKLNSRNFLLPVRYLEVRALCQPCTSPNLAALHPILKHIHTRTHNRRILALTLPAHAYTLILILTLSPLLILPNHRAILHHAATLGMDRGAKQHS